MEEKATLLAGQNRERSASPADPEHVPEVDFHRKASASSFNWIGCFCVLGVLLFMLAVLGAMFGAGVVVGRGTVATGNTNTTSGNTTAGFDWGGNVTIDGKSVAVISWFDGELSADNVKENLRTLTEKPHIAGSEQNHQLAVMIYQQWEGFMFDKVELVNYSVLLSYPNTSNPNVLQLKGGDGLLLYNGNTAQEPPLTPGENDSNVAPPFNAYSGSGEAKGPVVYVNYARIDDFEYLTNNLSLNLSNHVCIARYGGIFRGDKAHLAQRYGCSGLLIYSDPQDFAPEGVPVYPDGPSLPPGGVQRGSLMIVEGDPLTPGVPAIDGMYRRTYEELAEEGGVPSIPVQPISYGDAVHFMSQLSLHPAPSSWIGNLSDIDYFIAQSSSNDNETYLMVNNYQEQRTIYNVIATIYGGVEPDHQVIMGNHRDAWVFGAVDPNSGTAVLMEMARSFSILRQNKWRPGRTLVLCSWDAEEYGLIGSTEWVEDKGSLLGANTVAYLNVDVAVSGSEFFESSANPLLFVPLWRAAEMVKCPDPGFNTVYDQWLHYSPHTYKNGGSKPLIHSLGSGSDYTMFLQGYGISCTSSGYANTTAYAVYHSVHDNFYWMSNFGDPSFTHHVALGLVWLKTAMLLVTNPLLPYDPRLYAEVVKNNFDDLSKLNSDLLEEQNITLSYLEAAIMNFEDGCNNLWEDVQRVVQDGPPSENIVRIITDKYMNVERAFIHPEGLPGRPYFKHVLFAPSSFNTYASSGFPGISDTIFEATQSGKEEDWNKVRRQIDIVRNHLRYATMIMNEPSLKYAP